MSDVTRILESIDAGDPKAAEELLPLVYEELKRLAAAKMAQEPPGHTLQATALVHDAWLRLVGSTNPSWENRRHFFGAAAEAMRRILVEHARRKQRSRRGGKLQHVSISELDVAEESDDETVLMVSEALEKLSAKDPTCAELIKLRFFVGLPNHVAAEVLGLSERTAKRNWAYARAWAGQRTTTS